MLFALFCQYFCDNILTGKNISANLWLRLSINEALLEGCDLIVVIVNTEMFICATPAKVAAAKEWKSLFLVFD
jgi:hypothetical protein